MTVEERRKNESLTRYYFFSNESNLFLSLFIARRIATLITSTLDGNLPFLTNSSIRFMYFKGNVIEVWISFMLIPHYNGFILLKLTIVLYT